MDSILYKTTVEVLSPLHVGTGTALLDGLDWIQEGAWVYVANQHRLLETVLQRAEAERGSETAAIEAITGMQLADLRKAGWLTREDLSEDSPSFRYRLRGRPAMNQIAEQIKDVHGSPYLPGSSLKGALRTVLAVGGASVTKADLSQAGGSRSWAAQPIERGIFGRDPNHDLLRALQVSDSIPVDSAALQLAMVHVFPTGGQMRHVQSQGLDIDVEALRAGARLETTIKVDGSLFGDDTPLGRKVAAELHFDKRRGWLRSLPKWGRTWSRERLVAEADFYEKKPGGEGGRAFYGRLAITWDGLEKNEFLLQLGWGTGWPSKTFGSLLQKDPEAFEKMVQRYGLSPQDRRRKAGQPFPKSRKLARQGGRASEPLGWVKVKLDRR